MAIPAAYIVNLLDEEKAMGNLITHVAPFTADNGVITWESITKGGVLSTSGAWKIMYLFGESCPGQKEWKVGDWISWIPWGERCIDPNRLQKIALHTQSAHIFSPQRDGRYNETSVAALRQFDFDQNGALNATELEARRAAHAERDWKILRSQHSSLFTRLVSWPSDFFALFFGKAASSGEWRQTLELCSDCRDSHGARAVRIDSLRKQIGFGRCFAERMQGPAEPVELLPPCSLNQTTEEPPAALRDEL